MGVNINDKHLDGGGLDYLIEQLDIRYAHGEPIDLTKYVRKDELAGLETDPTVPQHVKDITQNDIDNWNNGTSEFDINNPQDGEILQYNSLTSKFENTANEYNDLDNKPQINGHTVESGNQTASSLGLQNELTAGIGIDITSDTISVDAELGELADVNLSSPTDGQGLIYDATNNEWKNGSIGGSGDMLKSVYDTNNNNIVDKAETLNDGTNSLTATIPELNHVHGVTSDIQTQINGKQNTLTFDSVPTASSNNPVTSDGIKTALDGKSNTGHTHDTGDITDINVTSPTDGQVLKYDGTNNEWVNANESSGGDSVSWTQLQATGTKIAEIDINGTSQDVYAPTSGYGVTSVNGQVGTVNLSLEDLSDVSTPGGIMPMDVILYRGNNNNDWAPYYIGKLSNIINSAPSNGDIAVVTNKQGNASWDFVWKNPLTWTLLGTTSGNQAISFPADFNELFIVVKLNAWNNNTFSIPKAALGHSSAVTDTDVPGGEYFKDGGGYMVDTSHAYMDQLSLLLSDQKGKLSSYKHNENSTTGQSQLNNATVYWYYR